MEEGIFYKLDTCSNTSVGNSKRLKFITPNLELIPENGPFEYGQIPNFFFYTVKLLTFTCSLTVGSLIQHSQVLTSVSSMAWEDSNAHCYLTRGHLGSVKGAVPLCWMWLWETRKWAIKRESDGKDKSFAGYMRGNGSLNTIQVFIYNCFLTFCC